MSLHTSKTKVPLQHLSRAFHTTTTSLRQRYIHLPISDHIIVNRNGSAEYALFAHPTPFVVDSYDIYAMYKQKHRKEMGIWGSKHDKNRPINIPEERRQKYAEEIKNGAKNRDRNRHVFKSLLLKYNRMTDVGVPKMGVHDEISLVPGREN